MKRLDTTASGWDEYVLLDSGDGRRLERFGNAVLDRPDPQALWKKEKPELWMSAAAHFIWKEGGERWTVKKNTPLAWKLSYNDIQLSLSFGKFKHIGIFPEHQPQWDEIKKACNGSTPVRVLNLFGYTGAASLFAAKEKAVVTHIDASKQTIATVKENIAMSGLPNTAMRLVCEDALKYAKRLVQRKEQFEIIIMDPPAFGRGPKGEVWKIEEKLPELLALIPALLSPQAKLVLLNGYAAGFSARSFGEMLRDVFKKNKGEIFFGEVLIKQDKSERILPTGIYAKWKNEVI